VPHLSMGQLLREEATHETELGEKIRSLVNSGTLVSDELAKAVLLQRFSAPDTKGGYILDGFPRNHEQFDAVRDLDQPTAVIVLNIPPDVSRDRLAKRASIENRHDDTPEVIEKRLRIYEEDTRPIIEEYRKVGIVREVDGVGTIEEVAKRIEKLFVL
jgi:adenylate kinase